MLVDVVWLRLLAGWLEAIPFGADSENSLPPARCAMLYMCWCVHVCLEVKIAPITVTEIAPHYGLFLPSLERKLLDNC